MTATVMRARVTGWLKGQVPQGTEEVLSAVGSETMRHTGRWSPDWLTSRISIDHAVFWRRVAAYFLDGLVVLPLASLALFLAHWLPGLAVAFVVPVLHVAPLLYILVGHGRWGQTAGKWLAGVKVVDAASGSKASWSQVCWRSVAQAGPSEAALALAIVMSSVPGPGAATLPFIVALAVFGNLWALLDGGAALFTGGDEAIHDRAGGTRVVRIAPG